MAVRMQMCCLSLELTLYQPGQICELSQGRWFFLICMGYDRRTGQDQC